MSERFHKVVKAAEVGERAMLPFIVNRWPVFICREEGRLYAFVNRCTHAGAELAPQGIVRRGSVICPLHGARFRLDTGECQGSAGYGGLKIFPLRESNDGWIEIAVPDEAPGAEHLPVKAAL